MPSRSWPGPAEAPSRSWTGAAERRAGLREPASRRYTLTGTVRVTLRQGGGQVEEETGTPVPERFVDLLGPAVRQAAAVARALEGRVENRPKADQASAQKAALTLADSAAQEAVLTALLEHFPGVCLAAEEDTASVASFPSEAPAQVVIDPIDGTLHSYLEARGPYSCLVGLAVAGRYEAALVGLPREGLFFDGVRGGRARRTRPRGVSRAWRAEPTGSGIIVSHELPEQAVEELRSAGYEIWFGSGGAIAVAPLIPGFRAGLRFNPAHERISTRGRIGVLVTRTAGGHAWAEDGRDFPDTLDEPARALAVAAEPTERERLLRVLEGVM